MASTPMAGVNARLAAINTLSSEAVAETVWLPFLHMQPDGSKRWFETASDIAGQRPPPFSRTELLSTEILASAGTFNLYSLIFQRYDHEGEPGLRVHGLWGAHQEGGEWKVGWRQYLGEV